MDLGHEVVMGGWAKGLPVSQALPLFPTSGGDQELFSVSLYNSGRGLLAAVCRPLGWMLSPGHLSAALHQRRNHLLFVGFIEPLQCYGHRIWKPG